MKPKLTTTSKPRKKNNKKFNIKDINYTKDQLDKF